MTMTDGEIIYGPEEMLPLVSEVETLPDYKLLLTFKNGERKIYDTHELFAIKAYKNLKKIFQTAHVECGTVVWRIYSHGHMAVRLER